MRHQEGLEWRPILHIFPAPFGDLSPVYRVVLVHAMGGGFWAIIHDVFGGLFPNSPFSTDVVYRASKIEYVLPD